MNHTIFTGAATAIITPFTGDGIDWDAFGRLMWLRVRPVREAPLRTVSMKRRSPSA